MMNHTANGTGRISHLWLIIFTFALVPLLSLPVYSAAHAAMSGTSIGNQASATYTDGSGVSHTVTSNVVYTIVQQVSSLTLTSDNSKYSTAGGLVSFPHTLTNTGNGTDSFALTVTQATTDSFDLTNISIYPDANGDGIADSGAVAITNTGAIPADGVFKFVVVGTLPPGAGAGSGIIQVTGTSAFNGTQIANNTDTVTVTSNAVINVTKSLDSYHGLAGSGPYTFTLTYTNSGNSAATNVIVVDAIPAGMTYIAGSGRWSGSGGTALTDSIAADAAGITYDYDVTAIGKITAVIANIGTGTSGTLTFQVNINALASSGNINNTALYQYNDGSGTTVSGTTNNVPFTVDPTSSLTITGATIQNSSQGSTVPFTNLITNTGNSIDTFDITLGNNTYPIGSTIVLYHSDGATPLLDTNGNGIPDTGPVAPGSSYSVVVKVSLPADAWGNKGYAIEKTATSTNDPTKTATATDKLNLINRSTVDLKIIYLFLMVQPQQMVLVRDRKATL